MPTEITVQDVQKGHLAVFITFCSILTWIIQDPNMSEVSGNESVDHFVVENGCTLRKY